MDGMVLIKNYLTLEQQQEIVDCARGMGIDPSGGGFYQPTFESGSVMRCRQMCLGKQWNCRTDKWEDTRENHDGAGAPPIPQLLADRCATASGAAKEVSGACVGADAADICIVNYYPPDTGRLGVHVDKSESNASLRAGSAVISFSIGDDCEFCYSMKHPDVLSEAGDRMKTVKLGSGDLLVFGGPARMAYHGVNKVLRKTAPAGLNMIPGRLNLTFRQY